MLDSTRKIIETAAMADGSVAAEALKIAMGILTGERPAEMVRPKSLDSVMSRTEVGKLFGIKPHCVDYYCREGVFERVVLPGRRVSMGISRASVEKALSSRRTD